MSELSNNQVKLTAPGSWRAAAYLGVLRTQEGANELLLGPSRARNAKRNT